MIMETRQIHSYQTDVDISHSLTYKDRDIINETIDFEVKLCYMNTNYIDVSEILRFTSELKSSISLSENFTVTSQSQHCNSRKYQ